jgi:hypothetical protein
MGSPFIYITYHDGLRSPLKYSRDGCQLADEVVTGIVIKPTVNMRSLTVDPVTNFLYVTDAKEDYAHENHSKIIRYGECDSSGMRFFQKVLVDQTYVKGAVHPYGLAIQHPTGDLYVGYQHTDVVLRFQAGSFKPMALPSALAGKGGLYPGTFFQFGTAEVHDVLQQGIRSIAFSGKNLWIANENVDAVVVVDPNGYVIQTVQIRSPIGLYYSQEHNIMFAGSKSSYGLVYAYNASDYTIIQRYYKVGMVHPAGLVSYAQELYVAEQQLGEVLAFDIFSGKLNRVLISGLGPRRLEQLALSDC